MSAVVYFGDKCIELPDTDVSLKEVCEAFGLEYESGVFIRQRRGGHVVATLPFDTIPRAKARTADDDDFDDEGEAMLFDLIGGKQSDDDPISSVPKEEGSIADCSSAVQEFVRMGAVDLLSSESATRLAAMDEYDPSLSPGLLLRCVYPPTTYSPYRLFRDPLAVTGTHSGTMGSITVSSYSNDGMPYSSSVDSYDIPTSLQLLNRPDLVQQTEEQVRKLLTKHGSTVALPAARDSGSRDDEDEVAAPPVA